MKTLSRFIVSVVVGTIALVAVWCLVNGIAGAFERLGQAVAK